ncbi:MAG TPA: TonB-dependent receptor [Candidatus Saccharimonadales bacterium]|nr:TonB-dependent receptor [Candidatus Saccharimonadales bacterium]
MRLHTLCLAAAALAVALVLLTVHVALAARVTGTITDRSGKPVPLAAVSAPAVRRGTVADEQGRFALDLPPGPATLVVNRVGYERAEVKVEVSDTLAPLVLRLREAAVPLAEVTVSTSSFGKAGKSEGAVLSRQEVMTTPGGAADIFQALRALPGINAPAEGAALYVRGGDPRETLIRLDGGDIGHPYHYEGASGGLFTALDAYMLKSAFFSSGGFSARYGGAMSGVLDMESQDRLGLRTLTLGANMAGMSLSGNWAFVPGKLALVGTARVGVPAVLYDLYGSPHRYQSSPTSRDVAARMVYRYSPTGLAALTYLEGSDDVGVDANYLNFEGDYRDANHSRFAGLQVKDVLAGQLAVRVQAAVQSFESDWSFGPVAAGQHERSAQASVDALWPVGASHELSFGATWRSPDAEITGRFPADSTDYQPGAPTREYATRVRLEYPGFYAEDKIHLGGPLYATAGARFDYASRPGVWTADPRFALAWRVSERHTVRLAAGRYHQLPDPHYQDPVYGNPDLAPLRADHLIAGYEWKSPRADFRVEAYHKQYHDLVVTSPTAFYANGGYGYARGVDVFLQGSRGRLSGWVSYGYLDARRKELDAPREVPASSGVKHEITLVAQYQLTASLEVGAKYNLTSGRPYTPVAGATYDSARGTWLPVYAERNSGLLPDYHRLDVRLTRLFHLGSFLGLPESSVCAAFIEGLNVLNQSNTLDYFYNQDYTQRYVTESYFSRRFLVGGVSLTW